MSSGSPERPTTREPLYPDVVVDLAGQESKPVACIAVVRRALQKAGHPEAAKAFTDEAFSGAQEEIFARARRYVTLEL